MYDRILVPTDGSKAGEHALEQAIDLARAHDATIRTLYVVDTTMYRGLPTEAAWDGISDSFRKEGESVLERIDERIPDDIPLETNLRQGAPSQTIIDEALTQDCDVISMATHGRKGLHRLLIGSVTERVVRDSPVPVLTVRFDANESVDVPANVHVPLE